MPKRYLVSDRIVKTIMKAAENADIHEICGVVFGRGSQILRILLVPNRAEVAVCHHVFWNRDVERARKKRSVAHLKILGYLHNHPVSPAVPSPADLKGWDIGTLLFICSEGEKEFRAFRTLSRRRYVEKEINIIKSRVPSLMKRKAPRNKSTRRIWR